MELSTTLSICAAILGGVGLVVPYPRLSIVLVVLAMSLAMVAIVRWFLLASADPWRLEERRRGRRTSPRS